MRHSRLCAGIFVAFQGVVTALRAREAGQVPAIRNKQ